MSNARARLRTTLSARVRAIAAVAALSLLATPVVTALPTSAAEVEPCAPVSTLGCAAVPVSLPLTLEFDGSGGGLPDAAGTGTGFTMVDPPSTRLPGDGTPTVPTVPGYEPGKLSVAGGGLTISSTKGIMFKTPATSAGTNSQLNALGVGVQAEGKVLDLTTTIKGIDFPSDNKSEQGGIWFGLGEDDYVKLVVANDGNGTAKVQLLKEAGGAVGLTDEINSPAFAENQDVSLSLRVDSGTDKVSGSYRIGTGPVVTLADRSATTRKDVSIPGSLTAGETLSDGATGPVSYAGLFATSRNNATSTFIAPTFTGFSVAEAPTADTTAPTAPVVTATAGVESVSLSWPAAPASEGVIGYGVHRSTTRDFTPSTATLLGSTTTPSYVDAGRTAGTELFYRVTAADAAGNISASGVVSATPTAAPVEDAAPAAPTALVATAGDASVALDWADNGEADLAGYDVFRGTGETVATTGTPLNGATPVSASAFTDSTAVNDTTYRYAVVAVDEAGQRSAATTSDAVTPTGTTTPPPPPPAGCGTLSTLACPAVPAQLPVDLTFSGGTAGLDDAAGVGTGFTMVDPPSARLTADGTPAFPGTPGYEPSRLTVANGDLTIRTSKGIAYKTPSTSANTNSQLNALGVGVAAKGKVLELTTTVRGIDFPAGANAEQGGLWFGLGEDDYVKLVVANVGNGSAKAQLVREVDGYRDTAKSYELNSGTFAEKQDVALTLRVDGTTGAVTGSYQVAGGAVTTLTGASQPHLPLTDGRTLSDGTGPVSFAGVFASSRNNTTPSTYIAPSFTGFSVREAAAVDAPPAAPAGVTATAGDRSVALTWNAGAESDLAGYDVYRTANSTVDTAGTPLNGSLLTAPSFTDTTAVNGTTYRYAVVAVDKAGGRSTASATVAATPDAATPVLPALPLQLNFQDAAPAAPQGWTKEFGEQFANSRGLGWVGQGTSTPLSLVGNGRTRAVRPGNDASLLQRTLIHVQGQDIPNFGGVKAPGAFEIAVPDGRYRVTVSAGDQPGNGTATCADPCYDSKHSVRAEGTPVITDFQATAGEEFREASATVSVTDGRLTIDAVGGTNTKFNYVKVEREVADTQAPAAPRDPRATAGDSSVLVAWTASPDADATGYRVYRSTDASVELTDANRIYAGDATTHVDATAVNGTTYHYVVTALDAAGNESAATSAVSATPRDGAAPTAPADVVAAAGDGQVTVTWAAVEDATGYRVHRSTSSGFTPGEDTLVASPTATTFVDTGRQNGTPLFYVVLAVDGAGNVSDPSETASATPTATPDTSAPAAPEGVQAAAGDAQVTLTWTAGTEDDLVGYRVFRSAVAGGARTELTSSPQRGTTYVDTTAANGTTYHYAVVAVDAAGNRSAESTEVSATPVDTAAPAVPSGLTAAAGTNSITLRWTANSESDLRRYRVYRTTGTGPVPVDDAHLIGDVYKNASRVFLDGDLDASTDYSYVLVAQDTLGNSSAPTAAVTARPLAAADTTAPPAPTGLTGTASGSSVQLSWAAVAAADLKGYTVYRSSTAAGAGVALTAQPITATTYTDTTAPSGAPAYYRVTASDTSNNESAGSNQVQVTTGSATVDLKINFQTDAAPVPAGYTKDTGAAYTAASGSGWITQDSLAAAERTPLDLRANARLRTRAGIDPRLSTILHMQYGDIVPVGTNGNRTPGAWERAVPNGRYTVLVSAGDEPGAAKTGCPAPCYDSLHTLRVEGVTAVGGFQATPAEEYRSGTVTVDVTDGKLTVDALGGTNTKINYVHITSAGAVEPDTTAPGAPTGLTASAGDASASLSWSRPAAPDVVGYHVYRAPSSLVQPGDKITASPVSTTSYTDTTVTNGTRYHYAVTAVDAAGNESELSATADVTPVAGVGVAVKVDFQNEASTPAAGYLADWGQAYGPRSSAGQGTGNTYGWVNVGASTPLSLVGNGRNRNTESPSANQPDPRLATMLHMQYAAGTMGVTVPGSWEMAVPNGAYTVTVALGDAGTAIDSAHWLNVENQNAVAQFVPSAGAKFATATRTVVVTDGRLTLSPAGGTNTKIAYVDVASFDRQSRPYTGAVTPGNGAVSVVTNAAPTSDNELNAVDGAVDETTLGGGNVTLTRVSDGVRVPGTGSTSGGGDTVSFKADAVLATGTLYRFDITAGVKDKGGRAFLPFSSVFTTATSSGGGGGGTDQPPGSVDAAFDKMDSGAAYGGAYTSLVMGPDGKLYAGSIFGQITRWTVAADGTLTAPQVINTVRNHASAKNWEGAPNRTIIGMVFDPASTPANPVLWITDNYAYLGQDVPNATGAIAKLSGPDLENYQEVVVNLPRSIKDHETNSLAWKNGKLLVQQGSMNAMGATDGTWKKPEHLLSAAMLELDPAKLGALPLDAATPDLNRPARLGGARGSYDPYAPGAPLTLYATGIRNAYDLVVHSNGHVYSGTNGSAAGGNVPATPSTMPASCAKRPDGGYAGPSAPAITNNRQSETDYVFDVERGKYYGHPNPERCEWILNAGNPTGYTGNPAFLVNAYPLGQQADPNYDLAGVYDAGMHASANGSIEYKNSAAFGGKFAGKLVVVRYSANQEVVAFDVAGDGSLSRAVTGITGFTGFRQPLDVVEDVATGNLYVTELPNDFGQTRIVLLKPQGGSTATPSAQVTDRLVFTDTQGGAASAVKNVEVKNVGGGPLTVTGLAVTGTDAAQFQLTAPQLPATVPAGGTLLVPVAFAPTSTGPKGAALEVTSNDPRTPEVSTVLRGLGVLGKGGSNEPSLQWILDTLEVPVRVGDTDPSNNALPDSPLLGDEVLVESFTKAEFDQVVEVEPLSLFGPDGGNGNVVTIAAHTSGRPAERTVLHTAPNSSNQQVLPGTVQLQQFDEEVPFGFDFTWHGLGNRVVYSEDALNSWADPTSRHKVRVFPYKNADGTVEPNAYLVAPEDVPSPVDYQDAVILVRNVKPVVTSGAGEISANVPELVFSGVKGTTSAPQDVVVTNGGSSDLQISGVGTTGPAAAQFAVVGAPQTLPAGGTATFAVRFAPGSTVVGPQHAALRITSDDATTPALEVGLHGLATNGEQGSNEPPLAQVVDVLGRPVDVGGTGLILGTGAAAIGDEVLAPLFVKAGSAPVGIRPVARYSPDEVLPFGWYEPNSGDPVTHEVAQIALDQEQTLNPRTVAGGASSFDPGTGSFGLYVESRSFGRRSYTQDGLNTGPTSHAVRTYPARDRSGAAIPGTYLVTYEDASNGDYQDYVFEVSGVRPAGAQSGSGVARIDVQPAASTVAPGYTADTGAAYDAARGFGWVKVGTSTPVDVSALTRDRGSAAEPRLDTLALMQPTAAQSPNGDTAWEHAVPNGTYRVTVSAGDPAFLDSVHTLRVEGTVAVDAFTPTAGELSRAGTVTVQVADGRLTVDPVGGTNSKLQYVDIDATSVAPDTTPPTVQAVLSGLRNTAGAYKNEVQLTVEAADSGSGVASRSYSLDGAAYRPWTAPVAITETGDHSVVVRAQDVAGNITTAQIVSFSIVSAGASTANVVLENLDGVPFADRLVMNRIERPESGTRCKTAGCDPAVGPFVPVNVVHDVATLRIRNTGTEALNVTGLDVSGPFALVDPLPTAPVAVGGSLDVPVRFTATTVGTAGGLWTGALQVRTDDADEPVLPVQLAGFWQSQSEGGQEPDVTEITKLFGYTTAITGPGERLNQNGLVTATGDEVLSPYWLRADAAKPVTVRQLAAFHTQGNTATISWHAKGSTTLTGLVTHAGVEGQSILPHRNGSTTAPAQGTFSPAAPFGFKIDPEWSDPTKNNQTVDMDNGCPGPCGHHVRFWPARDRSGAVMPHTWLVGMDYAGINYDYNDNVYLVTNMRPETAEDPARPAPLPGAAALQLSFDAAVPGTLVDRDGQGTGFGSTQRNRLDVTTGSSSYAPQLLDLGTGTLQVTTSGSATAGTNGGSDNTLVNGLQNAFDATGDTFTVTGRTVGPLTALTAGAEQQGIMLGSDQDNYVKVVAIARTGGPSIEFYAEQAGTGTTQGTPVLLPAGVTSLDLALVGSPGARSVRAAYKVDGATAWTVLPTVLTLPATSAGRVFGTQAKAGIITSHKGGEPFVASFDAFGVVDGDVTAAAPPARDALLRLDVAGSASFTDGKGQVWTPDTGLFAPASAPAEGASATQEIAGTTDDVLYRTYRGNVGALTPRTLSYDLPTRAATTVDLRLHFAERAPTNAAVGKRVFDIAVEGRTVRSGFDVFAAAGGLNTATVLPVNGVTVRGGVLDLDLTASVDYPSIAAIEVLCPGTCPVDTTAPAAPSGLTATASTSGVTLDWADNREADLVGYEVFRSTGTGAPVELTGAPVPGSGYVDLTAPAGTAVTYAVLAVDTSDNRSATSAPVTATTPAPPVQQPVRINAGGPAQDVAGTTWAACSSVTACSGRVSGGFAYAEADTITGIPAGMNNAIFQSEWTGGATKGARAFGFDIPVQNGRYQVKLHFAELNKFAAGTRVFSVDLERTRVLTDLDLYVAAGGADKAIVRSFTTSVTDGKVTIDFLAGVENAKVSAIEVLPLDSTPPAAVTGLTGGGTEAAATLTWAASPATDLAGYQVYRSATETGTFTRLGGPVTGTSYSDTTATPGTAAWYRVTALDTGGNESVPSATVSATRLADTTAPAAVQGLTATGTATGIALSWTASPATDLAGYAVYRADTPTGTWTRLTTGPVTGTSYTDATAPEGAARSYAVTALDRSANESPRSAVATATRPDASAPAAVTGVTATGTASGVTVSWAASPATDLAGYAVHRADTPTGTWTRLTTALVSGTTYTDTTAPEGAARSYAVTALDRSGNESARSAVVTATRPDGTAPAAVTGVTATGSTSGTTVTWAASPATDLAGYTVLRSSSATGTFSPVTSAPVTGTSYLDASAPAGATSYYRVTASDTSGNVSAPSATVSAVRPPVTGSVVRVNVGGPAVTTGGVSWLADQWSTSGKPYSNPQVSAIAGTTDDVLYRTERSSVVDGGTFAYAVPVANGTYDVRLHFAEIYWGAPGGGPGGTGRRVFNVNLEGGVVELPKLDLNALAPPTTAIVRTARATVTDGVLTMGFTATVDQPTLAAFEIQPADTTAPAAVTGVTATGSTSGVQLGWAAHTETDLAGYRVYRSSSATGTYTRLGAALLAGTSYTDTAAPAGATSYYVVTAVDRSGNESVRSAPASALRPGSRPTVRINAGGLAQTVGGTTWSACTATTNCSGWVSGGFRHVESDTITGVPAGMNQAIFRSEWTGGATNGVPVGGRAFGFDVPVTNGDYQVRLHFAELNRTAPGQRVFDVQLEGATVLAGFDVFAAAGGAGRVVSRTFPVTVRDGRVDLDFIRRVQNAKISAIEIVPVG